MNTELLRSIGLTDSEIKVYLALLELGSTTKGPIVDKSKVASSKIYELLEKLQQKGLVSSIIEAGMKYFEAAPPSRLLDYMKEKEDSLIKKRQELQQLIPELELQQKYAKHKSEATIYRGLKGVKTAYEDILSTLQAGDEYYVTGGMVPHSAYFTFIEQFHKRRAKKGIKVKLLYTDLAKSIASNIESLPGTKIKFVPQHLLSSCFVVMYKTKTLITVASKDDLTLFKIDSKGVTESFIEQFKLLWNQETMVLKGVDAVQFVFEEMLASGHCDLIGARGYFIDVRPTFTDDWEKRAIIKGFTMRNIVDPEVKGHRITQFPFTQTKYTLKKEFSALSVFWIYGEKVVISNWMEKDNPMVIVINNKHLHDMYKQQFELLWSKE